MKQMKNRFILVSAWRLFWLFQCTRLRPGEKRPAARSRCCAHAKWEQANIKNYEYHLRVLCFCPPNVTFPVIIKVQNGVNLSVEYAQEPKEVTNDFFKPLDTIDKLFDIVQKSIDDEVDSLVVEYDATYGYPKSITIDRIEQAIDDEIAYFVEVFTLVPKRVPSCHVAARQPCRRTFSCYNNSVSEVINAPHTAATLLNRIPHRGR